MTFARKLAVGISNRVVRWASPGCKEWAEGLAREVEFIQSDWAALGWALGSARVLFDRREVPLTSLDKVPAETQKLVERNRFAAGYVLALSIMYGPIDLLSFFFHARGTMGRVDCAIVVLVSIIAGTYSLMERRRLKEPWKDDIYDDLLPCTYFYKEQLKRLDRLWIHFSFLICWWIGFSLPASGEIPYCFMSLTCMVWYLSWWMVIRQRKQNNLRRIKQIDALLAEKQ